MNRRISLVTLMLAALCMTPRSGNLTRAQGPPPKDQAGNELTASNRGYQLTPGDVLQVRFFYNPELNEKVQIRPDGHITLFLVGDVELRSKTTAQATTYLEAAYKKVLKTPAITLQVEEFGSQKFFVGGEIMRPGMQPLVGRVSVLDAVITAGGFKPSASSNAVLLLRRSEEGTPEAMQKISMRRVDKQLPEAEVTFLQPFDVIIVLEKRISKIDRWVDQYLRQTVPVQMNAGFSYLLDQGALFR
jgi:polysaccharide biosynthesis/export protein